MSPKSKSRSKAAGPVEELTFEQAFQELEAVVDQLEEGQLALDSALALFARGQALAARCAALLEDAELKVRQLMPKPGGGFAEADFDEVVE